MANSYFPVLAALTLCGSLIAAEGTPAPATAKKTTPAVKPIVNYNIPLWTEGTVPLAKGNGPLDNQLSPFTVFEPPANKRNGSSVVVAPGGSNIMLMYGAEGMDIAEQYNEWGVTAFVLTYRMSPTYNTDARSADGRRADAGGSGASAAEMKLDPEKDWLHRLFGRRRIDAAVHGDCGAG